MYVLMKFCGSDCCIGRRFFISRRYKFPEWLCNNNIYESLTICILSYFAYLFVLFFIEMHVLCIALSRDGTLARSWRGQCNYHHSFGAYWLSKQHPMGLCFWAKTHAKLYEHTFRSTFFVKYTVEF